MTTDDRTDGGAAPPFRATGYPWRLYVGAGALDQLPAEVARHRARRAFVVCGRTVAQRTNLLARIRDGLGEAYAGVFDRMDKDSTYPAVLAATEGLTVVNRAQLLGTYDVDYGNAKFLVRVTKTDTGAYVAAVDPRGLPAGGEAPQRLIAALKAALAP